MDKKPLLDADGKPVMFMGFPVVLVDDLPEVTGVVFGPPLIEPLPRRLVTIASPPAPDHPPRDLP